MSIGTCHRCDRATLSDAVLRCGESGRPALDHASAAGTCPLGRFTDPGARLPPPMPIPDGYDGKRDFHDGGCNCGGEDRTPPSSGE